MEHRVYVDVLVWCQPDGNHKPLKVRIEDVGFSISKVRDVRQAASLKAGGEGIRYTCEILVPLDEMRVRSAELLLFNCEDLWFVESGQAEDLMRSAASA